MKQKNIITILLIIISAVFTVGIIFLVKNNNSQKSISQQSPEISSKSEKNIANQAPVLKQENNIVSKKEVGAEYYKTEIKDGWSTGFKLIFVNGGVDSIDEDCAFHIYEGNSMIGGWYTYEEMYSNKHWFFNIKYYYDKNGKKVSEDEKNIPRINIVDASDELEKRLIKSSKKNLEEITIQGLYAYCEGPPAASIEKGSKVFAKEIETGRWSH